VTSNADIVLDQFTRQATPFADIPVIRRMFEDSLADDGLGMKTRRKARSGIHGPIERNALRIGYMGPGSRCARPG